MRHLDEGALRRMIDEPEEFDAEAHRHAAECAECRSRGDAVRADAQFVAGSMSGSCSVDVDAAQSRMERVLYAPQRRARWYLPAALSAAAALVLALVFSPLGGYASAFLTIFQPKEFIPIDVTQADLRQLRIAPQADELGTVRVLVRPQHSSYSSVQAASAHVDFHPRVPSQIPSALGPGRSFFVSTPAEYLYTFSAAKARAFEAKSHKQLPPMPASLNGTAVHVRVGQLFGAHYGPGSPKRANERDGDEREGLTVVEIQVPTVRSTGASFQELERYMLAMPGISPDLAMQLRALGDLQNRMPVPVNVSKQNAQQVTVDGVQGLAIGDNTGLGAGVMWQKNGIVYGVMGSSLTMDQVLALANGLH